jgi:glycosyltransferase involved in cell wall biosynthesis
MHIVFVTAFFTENERNPLTGMPGYIYKISNFLVLRGHQVEIVAGARYNKKWIYKGITIYNCKIPEILNRGTFENSFKILQREKVFQSKLKELDRSLPIDVVQYAGWSGVGLLHSLKCPGVLRISTYSCVQYKESEILKNTGCLSFWERMAGIHADGILSPSNVLGDKFGYDIRKKVVLMETPYNDSIIEDSKLYDTKLEGKKYLLFFGQTSREKGFQVIQDMMPRFMETYKDFWFVVAGWNSPQAGSDAISILKCKLGKYENHFMFLGPVSQTQLYPIIRNAVCVLIPSLIDNLPNACLEALFLGQVVVGTYGTSIEQMIQNNFNGFLVEPGDSKALLEMVFKVCALRDHERRHMIKNSRKILKRYSPEYAVAKLEKYYRWIIRHKMG